MPCAVAPDVSSAETHLRFAKAPLLVMSCLASAKQKQHYALSSVSIRVHPAKNTRCYISNVFYQYMLIHPTTVTLACNIFM